MKFSLPAAFLVAAGLLLSGCAEPPAPLPPSAEAAAARGDAVLVSKGLAVTPYGAAQGSLMFQNAATGRSVNVMSEQTAWASATVGYRVQTIQAGTYYLSYVTVGASSRVGRERDGAGTFTVRPGEILYLGDIELNEVVHRGSSYADVVVRDRGAAARAALSAEAPGLAGAMRTELLACAFCRSAP